MTDRIIDITDFPAMLTARGGLLVIGRRAETPGEEEAEGEPPVREVEKSPGARAHDPAAPRDEPVTVPFEEIAAIVAAGPRMAISRAAAARLAGAGGALVFCDDRFTPASLCLPIAGNTVQTERIAAQAAAPLPLKKRLWQQVARAKIEAQARLLSEVRGGDSGIARLAERVRSGDPDNIEGQAARLYWPALFFDPGFRRGRDLGGPNDFLNYGYAVLRAVIARAVCASGLHPSLGIHHHNRYDSFCLASDLMEPFRPLVDRAVVSLLAASGPRATLDRRARNSILSSLTGCVESGDGSRTLFDAAARASSSLASVFTGDRKNLSLPKI